MGFFSFFKKEKTKETAKDRLKLVLIQDRAMISPTVLDDIRNDIIDVISKYVDIDKKNISIDVSSSKGDSRKTALIASIPILSKMGKGRV